MFGANAFDASGHVEVLVVQCASVLLARAGVSTALSFQVGWDSRRQTQYGSNRQLLMQCSYTHFALVSSTHWALHKQQKEPIVRSLIMKIILSRRANIRQ